MKTPDTVHPGGAVSPELYRLVTLKYALRLEIMGLRKRGRQASTIIREEFQDWPHVDTLKKETLLRHLTDYIEQITK